MANPQFKRGATLGLAIAASATIIAGVVPSASAETRIETVIGTISGADPIRTRNGADNGFNARLGAG